MARLQHKVALITGGARGIGAAIARALKMPDSSRVRQFLHSRGRTWRRRELVKAQLAIISDVHMDQGAALAHELGAQASFMPLDVTDEMQWTFTLTAVMLAHGSLDILVNNAGITGNETGHASHDPENTTLEDWRKVMAVNLDGVFLGCKHAIKTMREAGNGGSIINMSSRSGLVGIPHAAAYAASKAAIRNHSKSVALYCAEQNLGIRCNSIYPASIRTPMWDMLLEGSDEKALLADMPLHRFGRPEEVAAVAILLASDEATYITGSEFNIDGGILAGTATSPK